MRCIDDTALRAALDPVPDGWELRSGLRPAAVLAPIWRQDGADTLLLTKRPARLRTHSGQVAFPGGKRDGAESPVACALREAREEVGLDADGVELVGSLPPRVSNAGFFVHVVVGRIDPDYVPIPDPREVEAVLSPRFDELADAERWDWRRVPGVARLLPHFELEHGVLWGLTGRLTFDLLERLGVTLRSP